MRARGREGVARAWGMGCVHEKNQQIALAGEAIETSVWTILRVGAKLRFLFRCHVRDFKFPLTC